ncbi:MAG: hypothetical protein HYS13_25830 [Planctomycetia bacterium]|nr:hypothetical protein [Planctomycetia bacterium]
MARHLACLDQALLDAIDEAAARKLDGLLVSMPPQHGKSELCSKLLPAWYLGTYPDRRVVLTSYEADFASTWSRKARDLLEQHGDLFGVRVSKESSAAHRWDLAGRQGGMSAAGVGGPITGRGAHLLIVDDPVKNDDEARSPTFRENQWEWWQSVASTRLRPGGLAVVVQTRWHRDDLSGRILEQAKRSGQSHRWRVVRLPALAEADDPLGRSPGEALWPEVFSAEHLERVRATKSTYYWRALYQQDPQAEGGTEWPDEWFRDPQLWFDEWPGSWRVRVIALDPSKGKDAKHGDFSAFVMLVVDLEGNLWVDADLRRIDTATIVESAIEHQRAFQADGFGVEINQFQELLADQIWEAGTRRAVHMPVFGLNNGPSASKALRIRRLTPWLARRAVRFRARSAGARLLVEQLRDFPTGAHDDGNDALEMAIRLAAHLLRPAADPPEFDRVIAG